MIVSPNCAKEGCMMVITPTRVTQMHDIVKNLQDGPESAEEILGSDGPWLGEELEKCYEVQVYLPFATCGNDQPGSVEAKTTVC